MLALQLPAQPSNARVKTWRRLQLLGAIPIKHAVYVLPQSAQAVEDFSWLRAEIEAVGGQATVFSAATIEDGDETDIVGQFRTTRAADFKQLLSESRAVAGRLKKKRSTLSTKEVRVLRDRLDHLKAIDFFGAPGSAEAGAAVAALQAATQRGLPADAAAERHERADRAAHVGRTWVTRPRPGVDRFASAWLVRRFIDGDAQFAFADAPTDRPEAVPFDMYEAGFRHEGDRCTFEVLVLRFDIRDAAVRRIGEVVHDIDLKDDRYRAPQAPTINALVDGLRAAYTDDAALLEQGIRLFDALYRGLQAEPAAAAGPRRGRR